MANLMVQRHVISILPRLPNKVQKKLATFINDFQNDPTDPRLRVHPLKGTMRDPKVRGAELLDGYRAIVIVPEKGDNYLLVHVDTHDEAYAWAKNKLFKVNQETGVFQIIKDVEIQEKAKEETDSFTKKDDYALGKLSDEDFEKIGLPKELIPAVKQIKSDEALDALSKYLPPDCAQILTGIACGMTVTEAIDAFLMSEESVAAPELPESEGDFSHLTEAPNYEFVLVDGHEDLQRILDQAIEEWRVFLHPMQRKLVEWNTKGPMKVYGSAGTGKTVVLMHRAINLASKLDNNKNTILFTTYTRNLSATIKEQLKDLDANLAKQCEVVSLHKLATDICWKNGWNGHIASDRELDEAWEDLWKEYDIDAIDPAFAREEFDQVVSPNGIFDLDDYLTCVRTGRGIMKRPQRKLYWPVFVEFRKILDKRNINTANGCIHEAFLAVEKGNFRRFAHVLVDEVQDFNLAALRLIRALAPISDDGSYPDPLCVAGDGHQRLYAKPIPLSRAGIQVVGRSRRLKINYRTTDNIRTRALNILTGQDIDDLDGGIADTSGEQSLRLGPNPTETTVASEEEEARTVVNWIQQLLSAPSEDGIKIEESDVCVCSESGELEKVSSALSSAGIKYYRLDRENLDKGSLMPGVRLASMKRIKGLEYKAVAMACGIDHDAMNDLGSAGSFELCERYVAATRARDHLLITKALES